MSAEGIKEPFYEGDDSLVSPTLQALDAFDAAFASYGEAISSCFPETPKNISRVVKKIKKATTLMGLCVKDIASTLADTDEDDARQILAGVIHANEDQQCALFSTFLDVDDDEMGEVDTTVDDIAESIKDASEMLRNASGQHLTLAEAAEYVLLTMTFYTLQLFIEIKEEVE